MICGDSGSNAVAGSYREHREQQRLRQLASHPPPQGHSGGMEHINWGYGDFRVRSGSGSHNSFDSSRVRTSSGSWRSGPQHHPHEDDRSRQASSSSGSWKPGSQHHPDEDDRSRQAPSSHSGSHRGYSSYRRFVFELIIRDNSFTLQ